MNQNQYVIRRKAATWFDFDNKVEKSTPVMYYQAHEGDGYLRVTADINEAHKMDWNIADSALSTCQRSRGNWSFEKVAL